MMWEKILAVRGEKLPAKAITAVVVVGVLGQRTWWRHVEKEKRSRGKTVRVWALYCSCDRTRRA